MSRLCTVYILKSYADRGWTPNTLQQVAGEEADKLVSEGGVRIVKTLDIDAVPEKKVEEKTAPKKAKIQSREKVVERAVKK